MLKRVNSQKVQKLRRLFMNIYSEESDLYGIYGIETIRHAINAGVVEEILYAGECPLDFSPAREVSEEVMEFLTDGRELSAAAICRKSFTPLPLSDLRRVLILDHVEYGINIGKIIYLAYSLGMDAVYVAEGDGVNYHSQAIAEISRGASFFLPAVPANLPELIRTMRQQGFCVVGTSLRNAKPLSQIPVRDKMAFIMGNENRGVCDEVLDEVDVSCRIEMENYDSLNVAIATGIVLYRYRV
jgi:TrmH family RNA methyltransferase